MKTVFTKPSSIERKWYIIDVEGKILGRVASKIAAIARGKNKAIFVPHQEVGDFIVVINAEKVVVTGRKAQDKMYYRHTGYIGGVKTSNYEKVMERHPTMPLEAAIKGMLPKGPLGRKIVKNIKIYAGTSHPHSAQNPISIDV